MFSRIKTGWFKKVMISASQINPEYKPLKLITGNINVCETMCQNTEKHALFYDVKSAATCE